MGRVEIVRKLEVSYSSQRREMRGTVMAASLGKPDTKRGLSVVVVGCGHRFQTGVLPVLHRTRSEIVALVDPGEAAGRTTASSLGAAGPSLIAEDFTRDTLRNIKADAVIIASPSGLHFAHSAASLEAGLRTFVEKPLACTSKQARHLATAAADKLTVSEQRVHRMDIVLAKQIITSGRIGEILRVRYHDTIRAVPSFESTWRNDPRLAGGGVLFDLGYHTVSTLLWLLDLDPASLHPDTAALHVGQLNVEDFAGVHLRYQDVKISIRTALVKHHPLEFLEVAGSKAVLTLRRLRERSNRSAVRITYEGKADETICHLGADYDTHALSAFLSSSSRDGSLSRHVGTIELIEEIYEIAKKRS